MHETPDTRATVCTGVRWDRALATAAAFAIAIGVVAWTASTPVAATIGIIAVVTVALIALREVRRHS